jgi:hypothetical protein
MKRAVNAYWALAIIGIALGFTPYSHPVRTKYCKNMLSTIHSIMDVLWGFTL